MARGGYRPVWACLELVVLVFDGGGELLIHAMKARTQFLDELVQLAGGYPSWPRGMVNEFCNQASLEESGSGSGFTLWRLVLSDSTTTTGRHRSTPSLNAPFGARCFLTYR